MSLLSLCCVRKTDSGVSTEYDRIWNRLVVTMSFLIAAALIIAFSIGAANGQESNSDDTGPAVTLELNKLEEIDNGCRVYFVISNKTPKAFKTYNIDLILFRTDKVIGKRIYADLAPLRAERERQVKLFDLDGIKCAEIGSLHVNDTVECKTDDGAFDQCFSRLSVSSLGSVKLSK